PKPKQHLYLVVDDWERGYSIRKLDVDAFLAESPDSDTDLLPPEQLTEPPVARMEALHETSCEFISHGTKIFAMQPGEAKPAIPAFDTATLGLAICPWPSCRGDYSDPLFASVGGKLFLFTNALAEYLGDQPSYDSTAPWSWTPIGKARPPFYTSQVLCHALHPDGRTLFVSAGSRFRRQQGTFSFDAERLRWTRHGDWVLPFTGQAYFDAELEAWVGLCGDERRNGVGYLCCSDVAPVAAEFTTPPRWKLGRRQDKVCRKGTELSLGARLLYCLLHKDDQHLGQDHVHDAQHPRPRRRVLRMMTFGLKYNSKGELQMKLQRAGACKMYERPHDFGES
ncbi:hypothetical protein BS78_03G116200, partial [Paspalum vaginatum]